MIALLLAPKLFTNISLNRNRQRFRETMPTIKIRANAAMSPQDGSVVLRRISGLHRRENGGRVKCEIDDIDWAEWIDGFVKWGGAEEK